MIISYVQATIGITSRHQPTARIAAVFNGNTTTTTPTIDILLRPRRRTTTSTSSSTTTTTTTKEQTARLFSSILDDTSTTTTTTSTMNNVTNNNRTTITHQRTVPSSFYSPYQYNYNKPPYYCYQQRNNNHDPLVCYYSTSLLTLKQGSTKVGNDHNSSNDNTAKDLSQQSPLSSSPLSSPLVDNNASTITGTRRNKKTKFVPRKAAVELSEKARTLFQKLLENHPTKDGILLNYNQSSTGEPRMVFSFSFVSEEEIADEDEGVSLEVDEDGVAKSPRDALDDGLPKLWVHHNAFIKVLGCTVDVDTENITPILYDKEGFEKDANL